MYHATTTQASQKSVHRAERLPQALHAPLVCQLNVSSHQTSQYDNTASTTKTNNLENRRTVEPNFETTIHNEQKFAFETSCNGHSKRTFKTSNQSETKQVFETTIRNEQPERAFQMIQFSF